MLLNVCALFSAVLAVIKITGTFALSWWAVFAPLIIVGLVVAFAVGATMISLSTLFVLVQRPDLRNRFLEIAKDVCSKEVQ